MLQTKTPLEGGAINQLVTVVVSYRSICPAYVKSFAARDFPGDVNKFMRCIFTI